MERKAYVDFAKFLAIFFVLANHIELTIPVISSFGGLFYVPVFFVLAGYTYRDKSDSFAGFTLNKAKRLLVPYFSANMVLFLFFFLKDSVFQGTITEDSFFPLLGVFYARNCLYPLGTEENIYFLTNQNAPTWFLTALFLSYLVFFGVIRFSNKCKEKQRKLLLAVTLLGFVFLGLCLHAICTILLPWSLESIPFFVLYMLAGYWMKNFSFEKRFANKYVLWLLAFVFLYFSYGLCGAANLSVGDFGKYTILGFLNGVVSSALILMISAKIEGFLSKKSWYQKLCSVGRNTMALMNYHLFVFMFFITACHLIFPDRLTQNNWISKGLKFGIIAATILVIQGVTYGWKQIMSRKGRKG